MYILAYLGEGDLLRCDHTHLGTTSVCRPRVVQLVADYPYSIFPTARNTKQTITVNKAIETDLVRQTTTISPGTNNVRDYGRFWVSIR